ncbi:MULTISPECIES: asparagine synthase (glutamine-hydrolyzing) [unclassified Bradyrhizobium]|uniref:asparagine synthase (glutamine-hydrolyzing) n=1 Tax=unclassified Bradyrhizobium TaxID=2631580 RepID=UPI001FFBA61D|nr:MULTISPECIES: asparagine synthase (glutamine-hydrolyzing) [unclassified Bradyrhizobium]MCK1519568.1 asparagine synthase (glutamine-hydrolyzing) [Bradyrhizobium sp. 17]MCK1605951.1 asparagine synthase (glutamine-hydrolyzing) [Bradyrhizobium sp. 166]MCK1691105.1 asparagine synthase (glutamine-hydrolyzing) [Bradyrhizobium sp. 145]
MCGIAGFLADPSSRTSLDQLKSIANAMDVSLEHRGPDDHGIWVDPEAGVALVHRRLSIVDLSPAGHQPMHSADGRYVIVYNGEVYSHLPIRAEIEATGHRFRGHSDTEVMLESFARYGIRATADRLIGMFAIAIWDKQTRTLKLLRDRLGIKPIYWAKIAGLFMFGSELKALRQHPGWTPRIEPAAVASFTRHNYIPAPHSIYQGVHKLEPGTILTLEFGREPQLEKFWDARQVALDGIRNPLTGDDASLVEQLETLLVDAVRKRMMADVPLGAFLSGGIDSSTVVALMKAANVGPVKTFSIGFEEKAFNEAPHAAAIAKHLGTDHTELIVTSQQALEVVPKLSEIFDEPFADSSQIPTYLVSAMTREHVTVALSGDGGDELFSGYNRYQLTRRSWRMLSLVPAPLRRALAAGLTSVSTERWNAIFEYLPEHSYPRLPGDKIHKFANVLGLNDVDELYRRLISHWDPSRIAPSLAETRGVLWDSSVRTDFPNLLDRMQFLDSVTYLPDDILTKVDRASMAVALEARVPLLDHRVVEMAWRLPHSVKIRRGVSKWLLRQVLYRYVPKSLVERPKMGFAIPLDEWLRGPLRQWAENLLSEKRLRETDFFDVALIRRHWTEHLSRKRNWQYALWDVLMFESWRERWG